MKHEQTIEQRIPAAFSYPVVFSRKIFSPGHPALAALLHRARDGDEPCRVLCFVDEAVARSHADLLSDFRAALQAADPTAQLLHDPRPVPGGEAIKNDYRLIMEMLDTLLEHRLCRHSLVFAIGGGAVLDAVGFAAALVHRGVRLVRVPTTVLAQCDAGLGVKNGMNLHGGKNVVGTFAPPYAVLNDADFLDTLPMEHWIGGVSEAFKVALIKDARFFESLCAEAPLVAGRDAPAMARIVRRCAELHLEHLRAGGDPFELGEARPLDFGHWSAHKLEALSNYRIGHGAAVATGIAIDTCIAAELGWVSEPVRDALLAALETIGFRLWHEELGWTQGDGTLSILRGLEEFREHLGGRLTLILPEGPGQGRVLHEVAPASVERAVRRLATRAPAGKEFG